MEPNLRIHTVPYTFPANEFGIGKWSPKDVAKTKFIILGFSIYQMITAYITWRDVGEVEINGSKQSQTQAPGNCWVIEYQKSTIKAIIKYAQLVIVVGWFYLSYCSLGIAGYHKVNKRHYKIAL